MKNRMYSPLGLLGLITLFFSFSQVSAVNLALNKTVTTSSNYNSSYAGNKAVDGVVSASSKWTSNGGSASPWMYVDLGSDQNIGSVVVKHAGAAGEATYYNTSDYGIYTWNGASWDLRASKSGNTANTTTHNFTATARYVLLQIWDAGIDNYARIPEFEVHSSGSSGGGCNISLNSGGTSSISWIYANSSFTSRTCGSIGAGCGSNNWNVTCSSGCGYHIDDDYYADDWIRFNGSGGNISCGENVYAPFAGTVLFAGRLTYSYGRTVIIRSSANNGFAFRVAHLQSIASGVTTNSSVSEGQYIGQVGNDDGTANGEGSGFVCHAHAVLYKNINNSTALSNLGGGHAPSGDIGSQTAATTYAAPYYLDACGSNKQSGASSPEALESAIQALHGKTVGLSDLEVFPNPFQDQASIRWVQGEEQTVRVKLLNMMGQTVRELSSSQSFAPGQNSLSLSAEGIPTGMYLLVVQAGKQSLTRKINLQR